MTSVAVKHFPMLIDGDDADSASRYEVRSPASGEIVATVAKGTREHADTAVAAARRSFDSGVWANRTPAERFAVLQDIGARLEADIPNLIELETLANGATARQASGFHIGMAVPHFQYLASQVLSYEFDTEVEVDPIPTASRKTIRRVPIGVVSAVIAWNFPLLLAVWKTAPALAAGCSVVVKVDERAPLSVLRFAEIAREAGLPDGVLNVITGPGPEVGARLTSHPDVDKVTFTGSTAVGREIMRSASDTVKNVSLELGGKNPLIILDDADLDVAADAALFGAMLYSGQICASISRLLVPDSLHDELIARLVERASTLMVGDPSDPRTDVGPVITRAQRDRILGYVNGAVDQGAVVAFGGRVPQTELPDGNWVEPTILTNMRNDMTAACEEIFGPVLSVIRYRDVDEAVAIANDTIYGLTAGVWGTDLDRAATVAKQLRAGTVWVNNWDMLHPALPFGGFKQSGIGREMGPTAIDEFVELQHLHVDLSERLDQHIFGILLSTPPRP